MRIRLRKFKWKYEDLDDEFEYFEDDYVRIFFMTSFFWYLIQSLEIKSIFDILAKIIGYTLLIIFGLYIDLILLPFKLLYSIKIK